MTRKFDSLARFVSALQGFAKEDGIHKTSHPDVRVGRTSKPMKQDVDYHETQILIVGQGLKRCSVGDQEYPHGAGEILLVFLPMPLVSEIAEVSAEKPFLAAGIRFDLSRAVKVINRIEQIQSADSESASPEGSGIVTVSADDSLLDAMSRFLEIQKSPRDSQFLGEAILDEIYYRLFCSSKGVNYNYILGQQGNVQHISKAIDYIHNNLDKVISMDSLAEMAYMSRTTFFNAFKRVMHVSPLQYSKSLKLTKAKILIAEGKTTSEAGYLVGYNSPAQFSREYKRFFGVSPSSARSY